MQKATNYDGKRKPRQTPLASSLIAQGEELKPFDPRFLRIHLTKRSHNTVTKIAQATIDLLKDPDVGREHVTTTLIADKARIGVGNIYDYFEDTVAIFDFVWPNRRDYFMDETSEPVMDHLIV